MPGQSLPWDRLEDYWGYDPVELPTDWGDSKEAPTALHFVKRLGYP